ncbi:MAG: AAA family ATPase [Candidatus Riflebacteria bacterium]|nr:AAA family ATPase [Candidatus Riflebacteria bacterium]
MSSLNICPVAQLPRQPEAARWLVEELWSEQAVGIVGGEPKCCKSFLALELALAVASGMPCLGRFTVPHPGGVLLFAAEDALHVVRERAEAIANRRGLDLEAITLDVITTPIVRLDRDTDRRALLEAVDKLRPRLLVLDPFVRLHRIDENVASEVAPLLAFLRELQRSFHTAVLLVHHARKGAAHSRAGQALRGSSELHAWGDSNLYMRRSTETLQLTIEHRAAAAGPARPLKLVVDNDSIALELLEPAAAEAPMTHTATPEQRVKTILAEARSPVSLSQLRQACKIRMKTLCSTLACLTSQGAIVKSPAGHHMPAT